MAVTLTINGTGYSFPSTGDSVWGYNVTAWAQAVTAGLLQKAGGSFTLTAELDFGATYGVKAAYFKSKAAALSTTGIVRLGNNESIGWRNAADSADLVLKANASNKLEFDGNEIGYVSAFGDYIAKSLLTTKGDIIWHDGANVARLPIGVTGKSLTVNGSGELSWANPTASNPLTTKGDIYIYDASEDRLPIGTEGQALVVSSGLPAWGNAEVKDQDELAIGIDFDCAAGLDSTRALGKLISQGAVINPISYSTADIATTDFDSTNKKFGSYSFDCTGACFGFPGDVISPDKGSFVAWYRNLTAGDYIAYNPLLGAEIFLDASGYQTFKWTEKTAATETTKNSTIVTGSVDRSADATFRCVTAKWSVNEIGGAASDYMEMERNGVAEGSPVATDTILSNKGNGGVWFFGAKPSNPTWQQFCAFSNLPSAMASPWTYAGTSTEGNVFSVSNGVLSFVGETANTASYTKTGDPLAGINFADGTVAMKVKVNSGTFVNETGIRNVWNYAGATYFADKSVSRTCGISWYPNKFQIVVSCISGAPISFDYYVDLTQWHIIWLVFGHDGANYTITPYIDGVRQNILLNWLTDAQATDIIQIFAKKSTVDNMSMNFEWFAYKSGASVPLVTNTSGNLDAIGITSTKFSSNDITLLQTKTITDVYKKTPYHGITLPIKTLPFSRYYALTREQTQITPTDQIWCATVGFANPAAEHMVYIAGDGISEIDLYYTINCVVDQPIDPVWFTFDVGNKLLGYKGKESASTNYYNLAYDSVVQNNCNGSYAGEGLVMLRRKVVLPVGLTKIQPVFTGSGAPRYMTYVVSTINFITSISKQKKLL